MKVRELLTRYVFKGDTAALGKFTRGVDMAKKTAMVAAEAVAAMAVATVGAATALGAMVVKTAQADDAIGKMSDRLGINVAALSQLKHAAELSGAEFGDLADGLKDLSIKSGEAFSDKKGGAAKFFKEIGVSVTDASGKMRPTVDILYMVAEGLSQVKNDGRRAVVANGLLGGAAMKLMPMIKGGAVAIGEMQAEASKLGQVLDETGKKNAADFNDSMLRMKGAVSGIVMQVARGLTPALTGYLKQAQEWILANRELIQGKLDQVIKAIGAALKRVDAKAVARGLMDVFSAIGAVVKAVVGLTMDAGGLKFIFAALFGTAMVAAVWQVVSAVKALQAAFAVGAITAGAIVGLFAVLIGLGAYIYANWNDIKMLWGEMFDEIDNLARKVADFFDSLLRKTLPDWMVKLLFGETNQDAAHLGQRSAGLGIPDLAMAARMAGAPGSPSIGGARTSTINAPINVNVTGPVTPETIRKVGQAAQHGAGAVWNTRELAPDIKR